MADMAKSIHEMSNKRKMYLVGFISLAILISWFELIDRASAAYVDTALIQATATFAIARGFNAIVSVLQSVQVGILGASVTIGEVLDPINDLVEQFSSLMKYAIGSLIIQKILLEIVSNIYFKVFLTISGVALIYVMMSNRASHLALAAKSFIFVLFLRYIIVFAVVMNAMVDSAFLSDRVKNDINILEKYPLDINSVGVDTNMESELKNALTSDLGILVERRSNAELEYNSFGPEIDKLEAEITQIEAQIKESEKNIGIMGRMGMGRDESLRVLDHELSVKESELRTKIQERSAIERDIERLDTDIASIEGKLSGEEEGGFMNSLSSGISNLAGGLVEFRAKVSTFVDQMGDAIPTVLNMMAVFFFRTFILPLVFLYLFLKGFKAIWGIDVRTYLKREVQVLKSAESNQ